MKKLRLELDALRVESFDTAGGAGGRGTVQGHNVTYGESWDWPCEPVDSDYTADPAQCQTQAYTCAASCNGTCHSCNGTCHSCYATCYGSCQRTCDNSCEICIPEY